MKFLKKNIWTICSWAFVFALISMDAFAGAGISKDDLMTSAQSKLANVFQSVKVITFVLGGFGLVGIAYQAIIGKVKWSWFAGLAVGLAVLAAAGAIVDYATGANQADQFGDTFDTTDQATGTY